MAWFKSDDMLADHPKVIRLGKDMAPAMGVWLLVGTWAARYSTDGFVPDAMVHRYDPRGRLAKRLIEVGLWDRSEHDGTAGYRYHDWFDHQLSAEEVEKKRANNRERQRRFRERNGRFGTDPSGPGAGTDHDPDSEATSNADRNALLTPSGDAHRRLEPSTKPSTNSKEVFSGTDIPSVCVAAHLVDARSTEPTAYGDAQAADQRIRADDGGINAVTPSSSNALHNALVTSTPTRPDPYLSTSSGDGEGFNSSFVAAPTSPPRKRATPRGTRIPAEFTVTDAMVTWARENAPNVNGRLETDQFRDYWSAKSGKDATKLDWAATWRTWMRKAEQDAGRRRPHLSAVPNRVPTTTARVAAIEALRNPGATA